MRPTTLLKKRLWHRCFPINFVKFLRTPFLQNTSGRLLLHVLKKYLLCTLSRSSLVQTCHYYLLYYFEVKKQKQSFANKISTYNAIKKRLQHRCFPGKFANFSTLQNNFGGCFCTNRGDLCGSMCGEVMLWSFSRSLS